VRFKDLCVGVGGRRQEAPEGGASVQHSRVNREVYACIGETWTRGSTWPLVASAGLEVGSGVDSGVCGSEALGYLHCVRIIQ